MRTSWPLKKFRIAAANRCRGRLARSVLQRDGGENVIRFASAVRHHVRSDQASTGMATKGHKPLSHTLSSEPNHPIYPQSNRAVRRTQ